MNNSNSSLIPFDTVKKIILFFMLVLLPAIAHAASLDTGTLRNAFEDSAKAEGAKLDDYTLVDQDGVRFSLSDYFKDGKPLVVSFIYTRCPEVCPTISAELKKAVDGARSRFGKRFNVLTIGIDPENDTQAKLKEYGLRLTNDLGSFRLASSDGATVKRLTKQFGFFYLKNNEGGFDHIDMVSVVRPDGSIYKQVYSLRTQSSGVGDRLEELITGKPYVGGAPTLVEKIRFFCYRYDPATGRYVVNYAMFAGVLIQLTIILTIFFAVWGGRVKGFFTRIFKGD